jgi:hypothetical protein
MDKTPGETLTSEDYFGNAERSNIRFRRFVIILLSLMVVVLAFAGAVSVKSTEDNHAENVNSLNIITENEVKLNQNLTGSLHCVLLLTTDPASFNTASINNCFNIPQNIISQPSKK